MRICKATVSIAAVMIGIAATASIAAAAYTVTFQQVGPDVVATGSGSINLSALLLDSGGTQRAGVEPASGAAGIGTSTGPTGVAINRYDSSPPYTGPASFGSGTGTMADAGSGDFVGIESTTDVVVPAGYVSGDPLSGTSTWSGQTFGTLGITPGTYTWAWGTGGTADSFTLIALPEPASLALFGFGCVTLLARRRT